MTDKIIADVFLHTGYVPKVVGTVKLIRDI